MRGVLRAVGPLALNAPPTYPVRRGRLLLVRLRGPDGDGKSQDTHHDVPPRGGGERNPSTGRTRDYRRVKRYPVFRTV